MAQNAAATFSRTLATWAFPAGNDITFQSRSLTPTGTAITAATLDGITAGVFAAGSSARFSNPAFLSVPNLSVELLIIPTALTAAGFIVRVGDPVSTAETSLSLRLIAGGGGYVWSMVKRGTAAGGAAGGAFQVTTGTTALTFGQTYHVVFVVTDGQDNLIYVNGAQIPVAHTYTAYLTNPVPPAGPLSGPLPILASYELAVGDPSPVSQQSFLGTLGRMVVYPYAVTGIQAAASNFLQTGQALVVGLGAETPVANVNRGPVAVPHIATGTVTANGTNFLDIDTPTRSFDANAEQLTALAAAAPTQGTSQILNNRLRYTPTGGSGGVGVRHNVPFRVRDAALLQSDSIARVAVINQPVVVDPTPDGSYPPTTNQTTVSNGAELRTAYNNAQPSTTIFLRPGTYTGDLGIFNFTRNIGPLVIRPLNNAWLTPVFQRIVELSAPNHIFVGASFGNFAAGASTGYVNLQANNCRASRCRVNYTGTSPGAGMIIERGDDCRVDRHDIVIKNGGGGGSDGRGIGLEPSVNTPQRFRIDRNYLHDGDGRQDEPANVVNLHECIQLGRGVESSFENVNGIVEYCLIERWRNESEIMSIKVSRVTIRNVIIRNCTGRLSNRLGTNNQWIACRSETGAQGFTGGDLRNIYNSCVCQAGSFQAKNGNITRDQYVANFNRSPRVTEPNVVPAVDCEYHNCTGTLTIGDGGPNAPGPPALRTIVREHSGTINFDNHSGTDSQPGTASGLTRFAVVALPTPQGNATDVVGPFAP